MTEGEYRVGVSFNPSRQDAVSELKSRVAKLIDEMLAISADPSRPGAQEADIAAREFENAAHWAVKALTKPAREIT